MSESKAFATVGKKPISAEAKALPSFNTPLEECVRLRSSDDSQSRLWPSQGWGEELQDCTAKRSNRSSVSE
jgi:hypothetical protein